MNPVVSIIMGSTSDLPVMEKAANLLNDLHVPFEMNALSAHRTPEAVEEFAKNAKSYYCCCRNGRTPTGGNCCFYNFAGYRGTYKIIT